MRFYLDASALTALILADHTAAAVARVLTIDDDPLVSDFGWGELVSATSRRVRARSVRPAVATRLLARAAERFGPERRIAMTSEDVVVATTALARFDLALKLPDAIHIAIAGRLGATLVGTDRQQVSAARVLAALCTNPLEGTS